jgi:hypothetical protein
VLNLMPEEHKKLGVSIHKVEERGASEGASEGGGLRALTRHATAACALARIQAGWRREPGGHTPRVPVT